MNDKSLRILKALSEKTRYDIISVLAKGEKCACELPMLIGKTQSNTSMHLTKLSDMGILESRKEGRRVIYRIKDSDTLELYEFIRKNFGNRMRV